MLVGVIDMIDTTTYSLIQTWANWAAVLTVLFATVSFWINFYLKKVRENKIKRMLYLEIRTIYHNLRDDLFNYKDVKDSSYQKEYNVTEFFYPTIKWLIQSGELFSFFKTADEISLLMQINYWLSILEKQIDGNGKPISWGIDFHFRNCVELRKRIIALANFADFIDILIMQQKYVGNSETVKYVDVDWYQKLKEKEEQIVGIIQNAMPDKPVDEIPEQYFGK